MLLEHLIEKAAEPSEYDWDSYYSWLYSELTGKEVTDLYFWICKHCLTVNVYTPPAHYGKCRDCNLIYMANHLPVVKAR